MTLGKKHTVLLYSAAVVMVSLLYFFIDAREGGFFPHCPFNTITGLFCPGCGSQRAVSALLHLDIPSALQYNILLVTSVPLLFYSGFVATHNVVRKKQLQQRLFYTTWFVKLVAIAVILFWILRNIPVYPFTLLAP